MGFNWPKFFRKPDSSDKTGGRKKVQAMRRQLLRVVLRILAPQGASEAAYLRATRGNVPRLWGKSTGERLWSTGRLPTLLAADHIAFQYLKSSEDRLAVRPWCLFFCRQRHHRTQSSSLRRRATAAAPAAVAAAAAESGVCAFVFKSDFMLYARDTRVVADPGTLLQKRPPRRGVSAGYCHHYNYDRKMACARVSETGVQVLRVRA